MMKPLHHLGVVLAGWLLAGSALAEPGPVRDGRVEAELIAQHDALVAGTTATVGLRLKMDEGWHTYWKNPGDSGMATSITWDLPEGFVAHEIDWPAPEYFQLGGLASYAYEGEIVLPVRVEVPAEFADHKVTLRLEADWLVCREQCEPGSAALALTLPVRSATDTTAAEVEVDPRWSPLFDWAESHQPEPIRDDAVSALVVGERYVLVVTDTRFDYIKDSGEASARFFPDDPSVINMSADQQFAPTDYAGVTLDLTPNPRNDSPERLTGVLSYRNGPDTIHLEIDTPLRSVAELE